MAHNYRSGVLVGNWTEDTTGRDIVRARKQPAPTDYTTTTRSTIDYSAGLKPLPPAVMPLPYGAIEGQLAIAHAPTNEALVARADPPSRFISEAATTFGAKLTTGQFLAGTVDTPHELARTELIRKKAAQRAAGLDSWDPPIQATHVVIPKTFTPSAALTKALEEAKVDAGTAPKAAYTTLASAALAKTSTLTQTVGREAICAAPTASFARSSTFSKEFGRGVTAPRR